MENSQKFRGNSKEMPNKPFEIPLNSNPAKFIKEASEWMNEALQTHEKLLTGTELPHHVMTALLESQSFVLNASRWLEKTGVTQTEPPSIESKRK